MAVGILVPFTFQNQAGPIPLSQLDTSLQNIYLAVSNFATYANYLSDTSGAANSITVATPANTTFAYSAGVPLQVNVANTNTSSTVVINVNGLGAKAVVQSDGSNPAIGSIPAGSIIPLIYDGTSFRIVTGFGGNTTQSFAKLTVGAPAAGVALTVNSVAGSAGISVSQASTSPGLQVASANGTNATISISQAGAATWNMYSPAGSSDLRFNDGTDRFIISGFGNVSIPPPASGNSLTIGSFAGAYAAVFNAAATTDVILAINGVTGGQSAAAWSINNVVQGYTGFAGAAAQLTTDAVAGDFVARTNAKAFRVSINNGTTSSLVVDASGNTNVSNGTGISPVYAGAPQTAITATYNTVLLDANRHIRITGTNSAQTVVVTANATIPYPVGTLLTIVNRGSQAWGIAAGGTDTLWWAANGSTGARAIAAGGIATLLKDSATEWIISGSQLS